MAAQTITAAPKSVLVRAILEVFTEVEIQAHFKIGLETTLDRRLEDFTKPQLVEFLRSTPAGDELFRKVHGRYPFQKPQSFYLARIQDMYAFNDLIQRTKDLASRGRDAAIQFSPHRTVGAIYCADEGKVLPSLDILEIPLAYERRVEIGIVDPNDPRYGERDIVYSLEPAFIWIWEDRKHVIICCSGQAPVRSVLEYGRRCLYLVWWIPTLTDSMYQRISEGGKARTATFTAEDTSASLFLDAQTITISDSSLPTTQAYQNLVNDPQVQQTSGYYRDHPAVVSGGFGVSRRYAHLWAPARMSEPELVNAALALIERTEEELETEFSQNLVGYLSYFSNVSIDVGGKLLKGQARSVFFNLVGKILEAVTSQSRQAPIESPEMLKALVKNKTALELSILVELECPNCGIVLGQCPDCGLPYEVLVQGKELVVKCPQCGKTFVQDEDVFCGCGQAVDVALLENQLRIIPQGATLQALDSLFREMIEVHWNNDSFVIQGYLLRLLPPKSVRLIDRYSLNDFQAWRKVKFGAHRPDISRRELLQPTLRGCREKCSKNHGHPTREICDDCLAQKPTEQQILNGELCWPRILGLPIGKLFDGIHHAYEIADVIYTDALVSTGQSVIIGLHLKSRVPREPARGLGRNTRVIKALFTQASYSAYLTLIGRTNLDVIGIAIPNRVNDDVQQSLQELLNRLGFAFLVVDEDEWYRILDTTLEQVAFNSIDVGQTA